MALPRPDVTNTVVRDDTTITVNITGSSGNTVKTYWINLLTGALVDGPTRVGDGSVDIDVSAATGVIFGATVKLPISVFAVTTDGLGNYSEPSTHARPLLFANQDYSIGRITRSNTDSTKLVFTLSGLPDDYQMFFLWTDPLTHEVLMEVVSPGSGQKVTTSSFDTAYAYAFTFMGFNAGGQWLLPKFAAESWGSIGTSPPSVDRVLVDENTRSILTYFTPPVSKFDFDSVLLYRDLTKGETAWNTMEATSSPATISNLKRGHVYQVTMVSRNTQDKYSLPAVTRELKVLG